MLATARERFHFYNDLTCLVKALEGVYTTIDLRNDSYITGKIASVDGFMNVVVEDGIFNDGRDKEYAFDNFFIHARNIRYVHIPESMPIVDTIKNQITWKPRQPSKTQKPNTFKMKRAMQRHMETVLSIGENVENTSENN